MADRRCEWPSHVDCQEPVVAEVGLPGPHALQVCVEGFNEFQGNPRCASFVGGGTNGVRCQLRAGHEERENEEREHRHGTTTWS